MNPVKTIGSMLVISLIAKTLGLLREMLFGYNFGTASIQGTAFTYASSIPTQFFDIMFASAISSSFIPIFNSYLVNGGKDKAFKLFNNFLTIIIILTSVVTVAAWFGATGIVNLFVHSPNVQTKLLTVSLIKIVLPVLVFSGVAFSMIGVVQSFGEFNIPTATSVLSNLIVIAYYILFIKKFGVYGLAISFVLGWFMQVIIQIPVLIKQGYRFKFIVDLKSEGLREIIKLMLPVMISTWVMPINNIVNLGFASYIDAGNALKMANTLYVIITGTFVLSVNNFIFQKLSKCRADDSQIEFNNTLSSAISSMFYFLLPLTFALMILSKPLVIILFQRGMFDAQSTNLTSTALFFYSIGIIGYGLQTILNSSYYAMKTGIIPLMTGLLAVVINFILSASLVKGMGVAGPALASAISINIVAMIMLVSARNRYTIQLINVLKIILSTILMSAILKVSYEMISSSMPQNFISVMISTAASSIVALLSYFIITYAFRINETVIAVNTIKKKYGG